MDLGLTGRAAFVAAASKGLGRAVAETFAGEGADVAICARGGAELSAAAEAIRQRGVRVHDTVADVNDSASISAAIDGAAADLGRLDHLIVNAGGPPLGGFRDLDDTAWQSAVELTLMSAVRLVRSALPYLEKSDVASITLIASASVRQPIHGIFLSNAIRPAVAGLAKSLANELAPRVRVNTVLPGRVLTDRSTQRAAGHPGGIDGFIAEESRSIPLGRFATPDEFAKVTVFVASPAASYVTGTAIPVDGGWIQSVV